MINIEIPTVNLYSPELHEKLYYGMRLPKTNLVNEFLRYTIYGYLFEIYVGKDRPILTITKLYDNNKVTRILSLGNDYFVIETNLLGFYFNEDDISLTNEERETIYHMLTTKPN